MTKTDRETYLLKLKKYYERYYKQYMITYHS